MVFDQDPEDPDHQDPDHPDPEPSLPESYFRRSLSKDLIEYYYEENEVEDEENAVEDEENEVGHWENVLPEENALLNHPLPLPERIVFRLAPRPGPARPGPTNQAFQEEAVASYVPSFIPGYMEE